MKNRPKTIKRRTKKARTIVPILGVDLDSTQRARVLKAVMAAIAQPARQARSREDNELKKLIVTPNPEIILLAQDDPELAKILNSAFFALPDGRGLALAARYLKGQTLETIPGRIIAQELVREASKRGWRVFLLGGKKGVAREAASQIKKSKLKIQNYNSKFKIEAESGPELNLDGEPVNEEELRVNRRVIGEINKFKPHLLFVGFGAPKQEKWLARNLPRLDVGVAMTIGGTLDYWAGRVPLPPEFAQKLGLEWLWRLVFQPSRAPRIFRATVIFPLKVFWFKLKH